MRSVSLKNIIVPFFKEPVEPKTIVELQKAIHNSIKWNSGNMELKRTEWSECALEIEK